MNRITFTYFTFIFQICILSTVIAMIYLRSTKTTYQINRNSYVIVTVEINITSMPTVIILTVYSSYQKNVKSTVYTVQMTSNRFNGLYFTTSTDVSVQAFAL